MSLRNSWRVSVVMSGLRSIAVFALRPRRLSGARSTSVRGRAARVDLLDELDLGALEEGVELFDVGLVEIDLGDRGGDLGVREHAGVLALGDEPLDLFEFLQFDY